MSKDALRNVVITLLEGIEEIAPLLDQLPLVSYMLIHAKRDELVQVLEKYLPSIQLSAEGACAIVLSKESYYREEKERVVAKMITASGIKAEPIFLVIADSFTWSEISYIVQHNHVFYTIRGNNNKLSPEENFAVFRGFIDKALLDFRLNRKLIELISTEFIHYIEKEELKSSKEEIEQLNIELKTKNKIDELTQLLNRKGIIEYFQMAKGRATRERWRLKAQTLQLNPHEEEEGANAPDGDLEDFFGHLSCMMIDIDNFKMVNDTYGHLIGDAVLRQLGVLLGEVDIFRKEDVCGRFGGEEFIVILPATNAVHALIPAEKLRNAIKSRNFKSSEGDKFKVTISIGVAELEESEESIDELINKADVALYEAKQTGKDKTVIYEEGRMTVESLQK